MPPLRLAVKACDLVGDLKRKVQDKTGINTEFQHYTCDGRFLTDDGRQLAEYSIKAGSVLLLSEPWPVVKCSFAVAINADDSELWQQMCIAAHEGFDQAWALSMELSPWSNRRVYTKVRNALVIKVLWTEPVHALVLPHVPLATTYEYKGVIAAGKHARCSCDRRGGSSDWDGKAHRVCEVQPLPMWEAFACSFKRSCGVLALSRPSIHPNERPLCREVLERVTAAFSMLPAERLGLCVGDSLHEQPPLKPEERLPCDAVYLVLLPTAGAGGAH